MAEMGNPYQGARTLASVLSGVGSTGSTGAAIWRCSRLATCRLPSTTTSRVIPAERPEMERIIAYLAK